MVFGNSTGIWSSIARSTAFHILTGNKNPGGGLPICAKDVGVDGWAGCLKHMFSTHWRSLRTPGRLNKGGSATRAPGCRIVDELLAELMRFLGLVRNQADVLICWVTTALSRGQGILLGRIRPTRTDPEWLVDTDVCGLR